MSNENPDDKGEIETSLTSKEQLIVDSVENILKEEQEFEKQVLEKGSSLARLYSPAVEAIRSFCGTDRGVSRYMDSLMETIEQKLANGEARYKEEAVEQIYKELDENKKEAFEEAAKNEAKRQSEGKEGMHITFEIPPERLFKEFVLKFLEKMELAKKQKEAETFENIEEEIVDGISEDVEQIKRTGETITNNAWELGESGTDIREENDKIVNEAEEQQKKFEEALEQLNNEDIEAAVATALWLERGGGESNPEEMESDSRSAQKFMEELQEDLENNLIKKISKLDEYIRILKEKSSNAGELLEKSKINDYVDKLAELKSFLETKVEEVKKRQIEKNFMERFRNGEEVYNYLKEIKEDFEKNGHIVDEIWKSTTKEDRGELVDMMVGFAIKNNIPKDEIRELSMIIEPTCHVGRVDTYRWLLGEDSEDIKGGTKINPYSIAGEARSDFFDRSDTELKEWQEKSEQEKKEEIENKKKEVSEKVKIEKENLEDRMKEIENSFQESIAKRLAEARKLEEFFKNPEASGVEGKFDLESMKESLSNSGEFVKCLLEIEEIKYLIESEKDELGNLMETHKERDITMREYEELLELLEEFRDKVENFERLEEEQKKEIAEGLFVKLKEIYEKNPALFKKLVAIGVIASAAGLLCAAGSAVLASSLYSMVAGIGSKEIIIGGAVLGGAAGIGTLIYLYKKGKVARGDLKKAGSTLLAFPLAGIAMALAYLTNGKNWDKWMERLTGQKVPEWARSVEEKK
jgi:hypothetical protein